MIIDKYFSSLKNLSCNYFEKVEKNLLFKLATQVLKNFLYYTGILWCIAHAHFCIAEVRSAWQIWEAHVCIVEAHSVRGFPPSHCHMRKGGQPPPHSFRTSFYLFVVVHVLITTYNILWRKLFLYVYIFIKKRQPLKDLLIKKSL